MDPRERLTQHGDEGRFDQNRPRSLRELINPLRHLTTFRKLANTVGVEGAEEYRSALSGLVHVFPQLKSDRDVVVLPDSHLEIGQDLFEGHQAIWERRERYCDENHLPKPESMISGQVFEIGGVKYLRVDTVSFVLLKEPLDIIPFLQQGYMVLDPNFQPLPLPDKYFDN